MDNILPRSQNPARFMTTPCAPRYLQHTLFVFAMPVLLSLALLLNHSACAGDSDDPTYKPLRATPKNHVAIHRSALNRDFLLSGSVIPQFTAATSTGLAGKIVRFELFSDGVDLYETTDGLIVTEDLPVRRLLTTFPVVEQNDDEVVIDFGAGMRRVFTDI
jgi:hypothetical protein